MNALGGSICILWLLASQVHFFQFRSTFLPLKKSLTQLSHVESRDALKLSQSDRPTMYRTKI